jgi:hypothetical protein
MKLHLELQLIFISLRWVWYSAIRLGKTEVTRQWGQDIVAWVRNEYFWGLD